MKIIILYLIPIPPFLLYQKLPSYELTHLNTYRQALKTRRIGGKDNDQIDIIEKNENMVSQQKDLEEKDGEIERLLKEMLDYKTKFEELMEENDELRKGMKQILEDVKEQDGQSDVLIHCPSLEKLVGMYNIIILYLSLHSKHPWCSKGKN